MGRDEVAPDESEGDGILKYQFKFHQTFINQTFLESQRDSSDQPKVVTKELPWVRIPKFPQP
jgi:hypothetical protein